MSSYRIDLNKKTEKKPEGRICFLKTHLPAGFLSKTQRCIFQFESISLNSASRPGVVKDEGFKSFMGFG